MFGRLEYPIPCDAHDVRRGPAILEKRQDRVTHRIALRLLASVDHTAELILVVIVLRDAYRLPERTLRCVTDEGGDRGRNALDGLGAAGDLFDIPAGVEIGSHGSLVPFSSLECPCARRQSRLPNRLDQLMGREFSQRHSMRPQLVHVRPTAIARDSEHASVGVTSQEVLDRFRFLAFLEANDHDIRRRTTGHRPYDFNVRQWHERRFDDVAKHARDRHENAYA